MYASGLVSRLGRLPFDAYHTYQSSHEGAQSIVYHIVGLYPPQCEEILAKLNAGAYQSEQRSNREHTLCQAPALGQQLAGQKTGGVEEDHIHKITAENFLVLTGYDCTVGVERKELRSGGGGTGSAVS